MQDTLSESSEHERHQLERPFKSLFCHISDYLKRCGRHHNLHLLLGLGEAYFEHMLADLINVVVQCFCKLRKMPNIDIDAKAVQSSSAPTSPSSQGDRATDKLDFTDSCNEVETDNGAHEGSPFGENSILRLMFAQNAELEALWQEDSKYLALCPSQT